MSELKGLVANRASTDEWYTPPYVFEALGLTFDLDPASPPGGLPWVPARTFLSKADDGLRALWRGRVWLNPPYTNRQAARWVERMITHHCGIALVASRTASPWWQDAMGSADAVLFPARKIKFVDATMMVPGTAMYGSTLFAWGEAEAEALLASGLGRGARP